MVDTRGGMLLAGAFVLALGALLLQAAPARAVVYCTGAGYPAGCVVRPVPGVGVGAPGVGIEPADRGGPVNRRGVR
jgi:hypothetical protein